MAASPAPMETVAMVSLMVSPGSMVPSAIALTGVGDPFEPCARQADRPVDVALVRLDIGWLPPVGLDRDGLEDADRT